VQAVSRVAEGPGPRVRANGHTANASVDGASAGSIGVGFAIPGNQARRVADRLLAAT
jgi:S1-C subfamily serine protease